MTVDLNIKPYATNRKSIAENLCYSGLCTSDKEKNRQIGQQQRENCQRTQSIKHKNNPYNGIKYLQVIYLIRALNPEYLNNFTTLNPIKKWIKNVHTHFSKKDIQWSIST